MVRIPHMTSGKNLTIALYSDDSSVRSSIITALGRRVSADLPEHKIVEFATGPALRLYLDSKQKVDLFILDGEAVPEGGLGLARQLKDEVFNCPPVLYNSLCPPSLILCLSAGTSGCSVSRVSIGSIFLMVNGSQSGTACNSIRLMKLPKFFR